MKVRTIFLLIYGLCCLFSRLLFAMEILDRDPYKPPSRLSLPTARLSSNDYCNDLTEALLLYEELRRLASLGPEDKAYSQSPSLREKDPQKKEQKRKKRKKNKKIEIKKTFSSPLPARREPTQKEPSLLRKLIITPSPLPLSPSPAYSSSPPGLPELNFELVTPKVPLSTDEGNLLHSSLIPQHSQEE